MHFQPSAAISRVDAASLRPPGGLAPAGAISLAQGEPDFPTPEPVIAALCQAVRGGYTRYGDMNGDPELRAAIAELVSLIAGEQYSERSVLVSHGAAAITAAILATVNPGDRVILPEPTYSLSLDAVQLAGGQPVFVPTRPDRHLDPGPLEAELSGARMVVLCNPVNPTGAVFSAAELDWLGQRLAGTGRLAGWLCGRRARGHRSDPARAPDDEQRGQRSRAAGGAGCDQRRPRPGRADARGLSGTPGLRGRPDRRDGLPRSHPAGRRVLQLRPLRKRAAGRRDHREAAGRGGVVRSGPEFGPSGEGHIRLSFATSMDNLTEGLDRIERVLSGL